MDGAMEPNQPIHVLNVDTGRVTDTNAETKAKVQLNS